MTNHKLSIKVASAAVISSSKKKNSRKKLYKRWRSITHAGMHTFTTTKLVNLYLQSLCKVNCVRMSDKVLQKVVI